MDVNGGPHSVLFSLIPGVLVSIYVTLSAFSETLGSLLWQLLTGQVAAQIFLSVIEAQSSVVAKASHHSESQNTGHSGFGGWDVAAELQRHALCSCWGSRWFDMARKHPCWGFL